MAVIVLLPLGQAIVTGFQHYDLSNPGEVGRWAGFENYRRVLADGTFAESLRTTLVFSGGTVVLQFALGLVFALALNHIVFARNFLRGVLLIPWVIPTVVSGLLWTWILNVQYGVLNYLLSSFHLQSSFHAWLSDPALAMFTVIGVTTWKWYPFDMLMLLAALQTVPKDLLEAAAVDGAGAIRRFWHIVIPRLWNVMLSVLLLSLIWSFQEFTMIWTTTKGGPLNLTSTVGIKIYRTAFEFFHLGSAAAMGTMWFVVVLIISAIAVGVFQRRDVTA